VANGEITDHKGGHSSGPDEKVSAGGEYRGEKQSGKVVDKCPGKVRLTKGQDECIKMVQTKIITH